MRLAVRCAAPECVACTCKASSAALPTSTLHTLPLACSAALSRRASLSAGAHGTTRLVWPTPSSCYCRCREASELLGALEAAAPLCHSILEELGSGVAEGPGTSSAALLQRALDVSELATALAGLESSVVKICLTAEPCGAAARGLVANCTRRLVACFGITTSALHWADNTGNVQQA